MSQAIRHLPALMHQIRVSTNKLGHFFSSTVCILCTGSSGASAIKHPILMLISIVTFVVLLCVLAICVYQTERNHMSDQLNLNSKSVYKSAREEALNCNSSILDGAMSSRLVSQSYKPKYKMSSIVSARLPSTCKQSTLSSI